MYSRVEWSGPDTVWDQVRATRVKLDRSPVGVLGGKGERKGGGGPEGGGSEGEGTRWVIKYIKFLSGSTHPRACNDLTLVNI